MVDSQPHIQMALESASNEVPDTISTTDEAIEKAGDRCIAADGMNMEMIQMMVNQLNTEIATFRSHHGHKASPNDSPMHSKPREDSLNIPDVRNSVNGGNVTPEANSPQDPGVIDQVRATTNSVNAQIEKVKRQIELQKALMKQHNEEKLSMAKAPETSLDDIRASIDILKENMEAISNQPIADIVPQAPKDMIRGSEVNGEIIKTDATCEDSKEIKAEAKEEVAREINSRAKDDLLKKYLLLKVVKDNMGLLTAKMNKMLAAKGIQPTQLTTLQPNGGPTELVQPSAEDGIAIADANGEEQTSEADDGQQDEYYMYNNEEDDELYEEDGESEDDISTEKPEKHAGDTLAIKNRSDSINESTDTQCKESNGETTVDSGKSEECSGTGDGRNVKHERDATNQTEVSKQDETDESTDQASNRVNPPPALFESSALADAEAFLKTYKKKGVVKKEEEQTRDKVTDSSKMRTYTLLLKLQKEMADMQLQMSRLQNHVRSTNAALQTIFDHEFSDM